MKYSNIYLTSLTYITVFSMDMQEVTKTLNQRHWRTLEFLEVGGGGGGRVCVCSCAYVCVSLSGFRSSGLQKTQI